MPIDFVACHFSQVHFGQLLIQDSVAVQSGQWPRTILVSTNQGGRGHGVAGLPASQLPSIRYASDGRRWAAVTLDVSASRCVREGGARRERKSGAEKNRGGKHEFSDREHCCFRLQVRWRRRHSSRVQKRTGWMVVARQGALPRHGPGLLGWSIRGRSGATGPTERQQSLGSKS